MTSPFQKREIAGISRAEAFTVGVLLILGVYALIVTPFAAGFDEETHLLRVWQISDFSFIPNQKVGNDLPYPAIYHELSYRREAIIRPVEPGFWEKYGHLKLDAWDYIYAEKTTRSVYSPVLLLPQSLVMRYAGRAWDLPALPVFYLSRLAGLLSYTVFAWAAVRTIPFGKWLLAFLALSPMATLQAATITADGISNGIGFLFIAGVLALAARENLGWKSWFALIGLVALLFTTKVNTALLIFLPLTILKPAKFKMKGGYILFIAATIIFGLIEVLGWNILAYANYDRALEGADPITQLQYVIANPFNFIKILLIDIWRQRGEYLMEWIGVYGHNYWSVPRITYFLYILGITAAFFTTDKNISNKQLFEKVRGFILFCTRILRIPRMRSTKNIPKTRMSESAFAYKKVSQPENAKEPDKRTLIGLGITFAINYLAVFGLLYITFTPVGAPIISGVQGRYFTLVAPLFLLSIFGLRVGASQIIGEQLIGTLAPAVTSAGDQPCSAKSILRQAQYKHCVGWSQSTKVDFAGQPRIYSMATRNFEKMLRVFKRRALKPWVPASLIIGSLIFYLVGLYLSYHVVCGTKFFETGLCYQPYYKNWAPNDLFSRPITGEFSLQQEIVAECDGMTQLRVWTKQPEDNPTGSTTFTLRNPGADEIVIDKTIPNQEITNRGWLTLDFPLDFESNGKNYILTIENGETGADSGLQVAYTLKPEYMLGKLYENGEKVSSDLVFQYGCLTGLEKFLSR